MSTIEFISQHSTEAVFLIALAVYAILLLLVNYWYSKSTYQVAHENFPKTVKHITEGFVSIVIFLLLFYLASAGILPTEVLITLVSVFATAGFLSLRSKE